MGGNQTCTNRRLGIPCISCSQNALSNRVEKNDFEAHTYTYATNASSALPSPVCAGYHRSQASSTVPREKEPSPPQVANPSIDPSVPSVVHVAAYTTCVKRRQMMSSVKLMRGLRRSWGTSSLQKTTRSSFSPDFSIRQPPQTLGSAPGSTRDCSSRWR